MLIRASTILVVVCAFVACDRDKETSSVEPQPVTNTGATMNAPSGGAANLESVSGAANAGNVSRYSDESVLTPVATTLLPTTTARTMPFGRRAVTVFESGGEVTVFAKRGSYYLVTFPNPRDAQQQLAGWVYRDGIGMMGSASTASTPPPAIACASGEVHVLAADGLCARTCTYDADCAAVGGVCDGNGPVANSAHSVGRGQYCIVAPQ
jgi:hypothetical protein